MEAPRVGETDQGGVFYILLCILFPHSSPQSTLWFEFFYFSPNHSILPGQPDLPNNLHHLLNLGHHCSYDGLTQRNRWYPEQHSTRLYEITHTGIGCAIIASGIPVYFVLVSDYPVRKPAPLRRFSGRSLHWQKKKFVPSLPTPHSSQNIYYILCKQNETSVSPSSCDNNGVAEAVCGRDSDEQVGLSFNCDCTTQSSVHKVVNNNQNKVFLSFLKISCDFR